MTVLDELIAELVAVRDIVADGRTEELLQRLTVARSARRNLPATAGPPESLSEVRVRIPDLPGQIEAVARCANAVGVNIYDIEIAHSAEGVGGVLIAVVSSKSASAFRDALDRTGYSASIGTVG